MLKGAPLPFEAAASEKVVEDLTNRTKGSARLLAKVVEEATKAAALLSSRTVTPAHVVHAINTTFLRAQE